jgi:hypothetical protein
MLCSSGERLLISIISGTGAAMCAAHVVARCSGRL